MKTLFDFITYAKGVEYLLAIGFIALFILIWEALSASPFKSMLAAGREDAAYLAHGGLPAAVRAFGHAVEAPFLVIAYVASVPIAFLAGSAILIRGKMRRRLGGR